MTVCNEIAWLGCSPVQPEHRAQATLFQTFLIRSEVARNPDRTRESDSKAQLMELQSEANFSISTLLSQIF